jgi:4-hydroxybenzoate polyprenyltransferase
MQRMMYTAPMSTARTPDRPVADALSGHWVDRFLPQALRPYARLMRLERPIGWWLLLIPCWWSLILAQIAAGKGLPNLWYGLLFLIGAVIMRGAGCTLNDIADRKFDARVARTQSRPLPSGQVGLGAAFVFLALQALAGLAILLNFNWFTVGLGIASLAIVVVYPYMKRITYWPQVVLGLAFNWGALLGWSAVHGRLAWPPVLLYLGGISWTMAYDTIYAHQDKDDDLLIGVKSTALRFGEQTIYWLIGFFALAFVLIDAAIALAGGTLLSHIGVAGAAVHAGWQLLRFRTDDPERCLMLFRSNDKLGLILCLFLLLDSLIP